MSIEITMPRLSDTMEMGTIIKWNVKEGDSVSAGDVIADVETDKATMEMQVYDEGTIAKILVDEGASSDVGTVIALLAEEDEDPAEVASKAPSANGKAKQAPQSDKQTDEQKQQDESASRPVEAADHAQPDAQRPDFRREKESGARRGSRGDGRMRVSPVARRMAEEHSIDLSQIQGSGPSGRIIKRDVQKAIDAGAETAAAVPPSAMERVDRQRFEATRVPATTTAAPGMGLKDQIVPLSNMRQTIAKRLVESKTTIPHYQVTMAFDMDPLMDLRADLNKQLESQGVKLSINDFLVRCCALAMFDHPEFNSSWQQDSIHIHGEINVGIAISIPRERGGGLVVGVVRNVDQKSLRVISAESKQLAEKARTRGLSVEEMSDSTFTLSNLGMYGVEHFTAIINPPNSAILAVGGAVKKPVVRNDELTIGHEMSATLSCDHRVIDGAMAAEYLATLKQYIEHPAALLV